MLGVAMVRTSDGNAQDDDVSLEQPTDHMAAYKALVDDCRARLACHGHDPRTAVVGSGAGSLGRAGTTEAAIRRYQPRRRRADGSGGAA
jgi:hypothetical protein